MCIIFISFFGESETVEGYKNSEKSKTAVQNHEDKMKEIGCNVLSEGSGCS